MKKLYITLAYIVSYLNFLFLEFLVLLIFEQDTNSLWTIDHFLDPIFPSFLVVILGLWLGKATKSKDVNNK
ncbi:hypothetical protein HV560_03980 [Mannheimia pernigra]|uniref:Uncharacterized protein n=1 Tax=Mannheimia pernigra TaxID=111844 RepID=A0ABD7A795_9PAST|nr:hypothetical protein [Mannheimia pernigra]QLB42037.1 hypothetical protein HV560_03980 [Mannheimia pernigra]